VKVLVKDQPLDTALGELNIRLKASKRRVSVERRGRRLYLRATLPNRNEPTKRVQQNIALGLDATPRGLVEAEDLAMKLSLDCRANRFNWADWIEQDPEDDVNQLSVDNYQAHAKTMHASKYRTSPERGANAWAKKWAPALKKMPPSGPVNEAVLLRIIRTMPEGSAGRRDQGNLLCSIGESLGLDLPQARAASRGYGAAQLTPRDIPSDTEIEAAIKQIRLPHWRWSFGMCAAYGLRPHEVAELEWIEDDWIKIHDDTKTGARNVTPCPSKWLKTFALRTLPRPKQTAKTLSKAFNDALDRDGITIKPYNLRHAYALRLMDSGVPPELGARLMGHSLTVHEGTYKRWLEQDRITKAMDRFSL
jgi:integrase